MSDTSARENIAEKESMNNQQTTPVFLSEWAESKDEAEQINQHHQQHSSSNAAQEPAWWEVLLPRILCTPKDAAKINKLTTCDAGDKTSWKKKKKHAD